MKDDVLSHIQSEFALWGIKPRIEYTGGGHIELAWNATPDKPERRTFIPKTGSDWRGWLNQRAQVRRMLKQDGLVLKEEIRKPKPAIVKALAAPEPVETDAQQLKLLRAEVADLSELVLNINTSLKELIASMPPIDMPPVLAPVIAPVVVPEPPPTMHVKRSSRSIKAIDYVCGNWSSTEAIARDMGLTKMQAYMKLRYVMETQGLVELSEGRWRKKQQPVEVIVPEVAKRKARGLNGQHKH